MDNQLRIYTVSVLAFRFRPDMLPDGRIREGTYAEQRPALIPAVTIQDAAEQSKNFALDLWPKADGWYGHQAAVVPVTNYFLETVFEVFKAGAIGPDSEEPQTFDFDV